MFAEIPTSNLYYRTRHGTFLPYISNIDDSHNPPDFHNNNAYPPEYSQATRLEQNTSRIRWACPDPRGLDLPKPSILGNSLGTFNPNVNTSSIPQRQARSSQQGPTFAASSPQLLETVASGTSAILPSRQVGNPSTCRSADMVDPPVKYQPMHHPMPAKQPILDTSQGNATGTTNEVV